jgi:hypothetical protein
VDHPDQGRSANSAVPAQETARRQEA